MVIWWHLGTFFPIHLSHHQQNLKSEDRPWVAVNEQRWESQSVSPCVYLCEFIQMNDDIFSGYTYNYSCTHHHIHPKSSGRHSVYKHIAVVVLTRSPLAYVPIKVKYRQQKRRCFCNCSHADLTGYVVSGREDEDAQRTVPRLQLLFLPQGMLIRDGRSLLPRTRSSQYFVDCIACRFGPAWVEEPQSGIAQFALNPYLWMNATDDDAAEGSSRRDFQRGKNHHDDNNNTRSYL